MRKNFKIILSLLTIMMVMCTFAGCGDGKQGDSALLPEQDSRSAEQLLDTAGAGKDEGNNEEQDTVGNRAADNNSSADESTGKPSDEPASDAPDTPTDGSDLLCVFVESIGDNSVVGNIISMEPGVDGDNIVVMVGAEGDNKKLVSIYFSDDASFVYQVIRNGDVETREGSFSDIGIGMILDLTGYYKGEDFYADKVVISDVIID